MKILVVSDTHGDFKAMQSAVLQQNKAEVIFHLGDGEEQAEDIKLAYNNKMLINVHGNCDWGSMLPAVEIRTIDGKKIMATHGHYYGVKQSLETIFEKAKSENADILLFGHTHIPMTDYHNGMHIMNPGSLNGSHGTYGVIDIDGNEVKTTIFKVR